MSIAFLRKVVGLWKHAAITISEYILSPFFHYYTTFVIKQNFSEDWKLAIELSDFEEILPFLGMQLYEEVSLF